MNIAYVMQSVKTKVNKRDTEKALVNELPRILITDKSNIEYIVASTDSIDGAEAGSSILLASTSDLEKYVAITLGASAKDIWCTTDDGNDSNYHFEYGMTIDKEVFNGKHVSEALEEVKSNKELSEALRMIGIIATNARYETLLAGRYGEAENNENNQYSGLAITDYFDNEYNDIDIEVTGRKGKLHLLRMVPLNKNEMEVIKSLNDGQLTDIFALGMIKDNIGSFQLNRTSSYNFATILCSKALSDEEIKQLNLEKDSKGNVIIDTADKVEAYMNLKF
jgi:hypothetical protein